MQEIGNKDDVRPVKKGQFSMFLSDKWYRCTMRPESVPEDPVEGLDVSVLQNVLLAPVLGIGDPKTDKRIDFVGGIRGMKELERRCHEDCKVAFAMYRHPFRSCLLWRMRDVSCRRNLPGLSRNSAVDYSSMRFKEWHYRT